MSLMFAFLPYTPRYSYPGDRTSTQFTNNNIYTHIYIITYISLYTYLSIPALPSSPYPGLPIPYTSATSAQS